MVKVLLDLLELVDLFAGDSEDLPVVVVQVEQPEEELGVDAQVVPLCADAEDVALEDKAGGGGLGAHDGVEAKLGVESFGKLAPVGKVLVS